jgi:hypothetical protein
MRTRRLGTESAPIRTTHSVILISVGPHRMGIDAGALKEIRNDQDLSAKELGCEVILSAHALFGVNKLQGKRLLVLRPGRVAVRVDRVDRMIEAGAVRPLPRAFQGAERQWYLGYILDGEIVFPMLNPQTLEREALAALSNCADSADEAQDVSLEVVAQ